LTFAGGVLVVAVLYWAQAVLVPFALAILLTFVLTPPVNCFSGGSVGSLPCCWSSRWCSRGSASPVWV
jgi:predicted PurR-regulated permease PerM